MRYFIIPVNPDEPVQKEDAEDGFPDSLMHKYRNRKSPVMVFSEGGVLASAGASRTGSLEQMAFTLAHRLLVKEGVIEYGSDPA